MTEEQALLTLLALGLAASLVSRRYLSREAQMLVAGIGLVSSLSTLAGGQA
jgi:hypothetical protein